MGTWNWEVGLSVLPLNLLAAFLLLKFPIFLPWWAELSPWLALALPIGLLVTSYQDLTVNFVATRWWDGCWLHGEDSRSHKSKRQDFIHPSSLLPSTRQPTHRLQQYVNRELPDIQAGFRKGEEPEIKLPTSIGSSKKQESSKKHLFLLYWLCQSLWLCGSQ